MPEPSLEDEIIAKINILDKNIEYLTKLKNNKVPEGEIAKEAEIILSSTEEAREYELKARQTRFDSLARAYCKRFNHLCTFTADTKHFDKLITRKREPISLP